MEYGIGLPPRCTAELETVRADGSLRWVEICSEVSAKDRLHDNLVARCRGGEEGDWEGLLPPTAVVRSPEEAVAQLGPLSAACGQNKVAAAGVEWYVKHPKGGGGIGCIHATDASGVASAVTSVLSDEAIPTATAVLQRALACEAQAQLPRGPSRIELRVQVLLRRR